MGALSRLGLECGIVLKPENIFYLTGYYPTARAALVLRDDPLLIVSKMDARLAEDARVEYLAVEKVYEKIPLKGDKIGVEKEHLSLEFYEKYLRGKELHNMGFIERMRRTKDEGEVRLIRRAARITEDAILETMDEMAGRKEREIAALAEYRIRRRAELAFDAIVAAGENSAVPHHAPGDRVVREGEVVILDAGARVERYNADLTRTLVPDGDPMFEAALEAQRAAVRECRAGNELRNADRAAREVLREYGYEELFVHSTGHGVGLEVHEYPRLTKDAKGKFQEGMVVTVEPGIYGDYGIRIEDLVLVKKRPVFLSRGWRQK